MRVRRPVVAGLAMMLATALTGCGEGRTSPANTSASAGSTSAAAVPLTESQIDDALIEPTDLGEGYVERIVPDTGVPGCLAALDVMNHGFARATLTNDIKFSAGTGAFMPQVHSTISTFADEGAAARAIADLDEALADCTAVDTTLDGASFDLRVRADNDTTRPEVDSQVNVAATGTATDVLGKFEMTYRAAFMQVGATITGTAYMNTVQDTEAESEKLAGLALDRLLAVVAGVEPSPTPIDLEVFTGYLVSQG